MLKDHLKAIQAPLKEKYRQEPESALITLSAKSSLADGISCKIDTGRELVKAGLHPATGGDGSLACSGDMLLEALCACAGVTLGAVSTSMGISVKNCTVSAEGDIDFRGTLGVSKEVPVGFKEIRLRFDIDSDADPDTLATLLKLTERYCVVFQTLANPASLKASIHNSAAIS